jgi:hypothetical protein
MPPYPLANARGSIGRHIDEGKASEMRTVRRVFVLLAAATGVLGLLSGSAHAFISYNHCEPLR